MPFVHTRRMTSYYVMNMYIYINTNNIYIQAYIMSVQLLLSFVAPTDPTKAPFRPQGKVRLMKFSIWQGSFMQIISSSWAKTYQTISFSSTTVSFIYIHIYIYEYIFIVLHYRYQGVAPSSRSGSWTGHLHHEQYDTTAQQPQWQQFTTNIHKVDTVDSWLCFYPCSSH